MKSKIIFCDTNVVFGLFERVLSGEELTRSFLVSATQYYDIYISTVVIQELEKNILRFYGRTFTSVDIVTFSAVTNIKIIQSNPLRDDMTQCVFDIHDAQILQDAVDIEADFLVTNNMKDFDIQKIVDRYNLNIINRLPPIPSL